MKFLYCRPIGVEIEINSFNGVNTTSSDQSPAGIHHVANLVSETLGEYVEVRDFGNTHWYRTYGCWVLKPDNSCGMEVCSSILQGWYGLKKICKVIHVFENNSLIKANSSCSMHVHVDVSDLVENEIANILRWWIKCEPVFFDSVSENRRNNRYCQFIGLWDWIDNNIAMNEIRLIKSLGINKYGSVNSFHLCSGARNTLEFRIGEHILCKNAFFTKNWIRLLIHFLETSKNKSPESIFWLDLKDVFDFLGFLREDLSPAMIQIRNWFLGMIMCNFEPTSRIITHNQISELLNFIPDFNLQEALHPKNYKESLYNKFYSI